MIELFTKMLMLRQLRVEKGDFSLLGQRVCVTPRDTLVSVTKTILNRPSLIPVFYEGFRTSFSDGWASAVKKTYGLKKQDYFRWLIDIANISGWGENKLIEFDAEKLTGTFHVYRAPIGEALKGSLDPVDHIWRGLTAGGTSKVFEIDIDWLETKCIACGDDYCEYKFMPRTLAATNQDYKKLIGVQLPLSIFK